MREESTPAFWAMVALALAVVLATTLASERGVFGGRGFLVVASVSLAVVVVGLVATVRRGRPRAGVLSAVALAMWPVAMLIYLLKWVD
jgi:hypothetical protein